MAVPSRDKVIQTENDYDKDVFNGDIGQAVKIAPVEREVTIRFDQREVVYDFGEPDEVSLAYAITIHKSQASALDAPMTRTLQTGFPGCSDLGPSGAGGRCQFGPHRRTAAAILLLGNIGCCRRAFHPGPPGFRGGNNGRPSSRTQSPLALLGRLGIRLPFDLGPAGFLSRRHSCPDGSGAATLPWGILGERGCNFTATSGDRINLALQRLDLFFKRDNSTELTCR